MVWIDGIDVVEGMLTPVLLSADGQRTKLQLSQLRKTLISASGNVPLSAVGLDLRTLQRGSALDYCNPLGIKDAAFDRHEVFQLELEGRRVLVPAAVLLYALVPRMEAVGDRLLNPASLDRTVTTLVSDDALTTHFLRGSTLRDRVPSKCVWMRYQWLTCFQSGRRLWDSVFVKASQGVLGLELPAVKVDANIYGYSRGRTFFSTRLALRALIPAEQPLPFAAPFAPARYDFDDKHVSSSRNSRRLKSGRQAKSVLGLP